MVSYSAVDGDSNFRGGVAEYLTCGNDSVTIDLYGKLFWWLLVARVWWRRSMALASYSRP